MGAETAFVGCLARAAMQGIGVGEQGIRVGFTRIADANLDDL